MLGLWGEQDPPFYFLALIGMKHILLSQLRGANGNVYSSDKSDWIKRKGISLTK